MQIQWGFNEFVHTYTAAQNVESVKCIYKWIVLFHKDRKMFTMLEKSFISDKCHF